MSRPPKGDLPRNSVPQFKRARLLAAATRAVTEVGYRRVNAARVADLAGVSRSTFYAFFDDWEDCFLQAFEEAAAQIAQAVGGPWPEDWSWRERIRAGLSDALKLLDAEPRLARLCVVESLAGGPLVLELRARFTEELAGYVDEVGWREGISARHEGAPSLTAQGVVGGGISIVHSALLDPRKPRLFGLLGPLMSMVVLPYLGPLAANEERDRPATQSFRQSPARRTDNPLERLDIRLTYRTAKVLAFIARHPGSSNRMVADGSGIRDQGQVSRLLRRLSHLGLIKSTTGGQARGVPNSWWLTTEGEAVDWARFTCQEPVQRDRAQTSALGRQDERQQAQLDLG